MEIRQTNSNPAFIPSLLFNDLFPLAGNQTPRLTVCPFDCHLDLDFFFLSNRNGHKFIFFVLLFVFLLLNIVGFFWFLIFHRVIFWRQIFWGKV